MKRILIAALLLLSALLANAQNIDELVRQGVESYEKQNYKTAYDRFYQAMKINPNHPEASKWFWKMKGESDVKNLRDAEAPAAGGPAAAGGAGAAGSAGGAGSAEGTAAAAGPAGVRYVYSEAEQQALLAHLKSLDERLALQSERLSQLSGEVRAGSEGVDKGAVDGRLLSISRDLNALSGELRSIDVREDLDRRLSAISRDLETLKSRDLEGKLSALSGEIRSLGDSKDLENDLEGISGEMSTILAEVRGIDIDRDLDRNFDLLSRDMERKLGALQERIQGLAGADDTRNLQGQLAFISAELSRLAEEQARAAAEAEQGRKARRPAALDNPLLLALAGLAVLFLALLVLTLVWRSRYQRLAALAPQPNRPPVSTAEGYHLDEMLATADSSPFAPGPRAGRDWPDLAEIPAGQRSRVIRQLSELIGRDEDLRRRLADSLEPPKARRERAE